MHQTNKTFLLSTAIILSICLCFGFLLALTIPLYKSLDQPTANEGQQKADELVNALEQYKNDMGRYPADLDLLVPAYLNVIPQPN